MVLNAPKEMLRSIGNCELLEKMADSGMGTVYRARNRATGQIVAVKVMPPFEASNAPALQRFARECRILSALNDPHIVRALDFGIDGLNPYLVMEFVEGESLGDRLARETRLPEAEAVRIIVAAAGALGRAHSRGLVHRNIKPDKILITADGTVKLTGLGLARQLDGEPVTRAGTILGTPNFMAPEQFSNASKATPLCDIYSLGATLYMAVSGELPFGTCKLTDIWARKLKNKLTWPKQLDPAISERTDRVIRRAMNPQPDLRPATCRWFVEELTGGGASASAPSSAATAAKQTVADAARSPLPPSADESEGTGTVLPVTKTSLLTDRDESSGTGFSALKWLAVSLGGAALLLSGLALLWLR